MREFSTLADLAAEEGNVIGTSRWVQITQERIDLFAKATEDFQWIHTDPKRTQAELGMTTIAHGFLTLSLIPHLIGTIFSIKSTKRAINYGANKLRFTNMVPVDSQIRAQVTLSKAVLSPNSLRTISEVIVEIENQDKPALVAETITLFFE